MKDRSESSSIVTEERVASADSSESNGKEPSLMKKIGAFATDLFYRIFEPPPIVVRSAEANVQYELWVIAGKPQDRPIEGKDDEIRGHPVLPSGSASHPPSATGKTTG